MHKEQSTCASKIQVLVLARNARPNKLQPVPRVQIFVRDVGLRPMLTKTVPIQRLTKRVIFANQKDTSKNFAAKRILPQISPSNRRAETPSVS